MATLDKLKEEYNQKFPGSAPIPTTKKTITETKTVPNKLLGFIPFGQKQVQQTRYMTPVEKLKDDYSKIFGAKEVVKEQPQTIVEKKPTPMPDQNGPILRAPTEAEKADWGKQTIWQKIYNFVKDKTPLGEYIKDEEVKQSLVRQVANNYGLDEGYVNKNFNDISREIASKAGIPTYPTNKKFVEDLISVPVTLGTFVAPVKTAIGLATFAGVDTAVKEALNLADSISKKKEYKYGEVKNFSDLLPNDANSFTRDMVDLLSFVGEAVLTHKVYKGGKELLPEIKQKLTKDIITTYNLPKDVYIDGAKVKDIFQTGTKISPEETELITKLGLDAQQYRDAVKNGITIKVPAEKITTITDKPYWAKIKEAIKLEPTKNIKVFTEGKPEKTVRGLLPGQTTPIEELKTEYNNKFVQPTQVIQPQATPQTPAIDLQKKINTKAESGLVLQNITKRVDKFGNAQSFEQSFTPEEKTYISERISEAAPKYITAEGNFNFEKFFIDKKSEFKQAKLIDKVGEVNPIKLIDNPQTQAETQLAENQAKILQELDTASKGERFFIRGEDNGSVENVVGKKSSFPKYIPENLRSSKLTQSVYSHIIDGTLPTDINELRLYKVVSDLMNPEYGKEAIDSVNQEIDVNSMFGEPSSKELDVIENKIDEQINEQETIISSEQASLSAEIEKNSAGEKAGIEGQKTAQEDVISEYGNKDLTPEEKQLEIENVKFVLQNEKSLIDKYVKEKGNYLNGDFIKDVLFDKYREDKTKYRAFQAGGNYLWNKIFEKFLAENHNVGLGTVDILTGGQGSGKSTSMEAILGKDWEKDSAFIVENPAINDSTIKRIIDAGYPVREYQVATLMADAFDRALARAERTGRVFPVESLIDGHTKAKERGINRAMKENPNVEYFLIDNTGSIENIHYITDKNEQLALLEKLGYNKNTTTKAEVVRDYKNVLKQKYERSEITRKVYDEFNKGPGNSQEMAGTRKTKGAEIGRGTETGGRGQSENSVVGNGKQKQAKNNSNNERGGESRNRPNEQISRRTPGGNNGISQQGERGRQDNSLIESINKSIDEGQLLQEKEDLEKKLFAKYKKTMPEKEAYIKAQTEANPYNQTAEQIQRNADFQYPEENKPLTKEESGFNLPLERMTDQEIQIDKAVLELKRKELINAGKEEEADNVLDNEIDPINKELERRGLIDTSTFENEKVVPTEKLVKQKNNGQQGLFGGGSPASIGNFRDGTPIEIGHIEEIHPIELPEMVDLARSLMGSVPNIGNPRIRPSLGGRPFGIFKPSGRGSILLNPEIFKNGAEQAAKTLAHEIGHLTDYLPEETLKRGNLLGRLLSLRTFMKSSFGGIDITNPEIKKELKAVSKYWKPWDEEKASKSFKNYRNSAVELYADAISVLFNSPGTLEKMAPKFYNEFFNQLDRKPEFKDNYFELQALLSGDKSVLIENRRAGIKQMFSDANFKSADLQKIKEAEKKERRRDLWASFKFALKSSNQPIYDKVARLQKMGIRINDDENPEILFSDRNYIGNQIRADLRETLQPIKEVLDKNEIGWNSLGEALMYERIIAGDRSDIANPRGITPKHAQELLNAIKQEFGDEKFNILMDSADKYRKWLKSWAKSAYENGMINEETYKEVEANDKYSPFQVIEKMENNLSWGIKRQVGTFKDINNPANAGIMKTISTIRAIERQKMTKSLIGMMEKYFPAEIEESKYLFTGKGRRPIEPKDDRGLITYYDNGTLKGMYVDKYIAQSVERDSIGNNHAVMAMFSPLRAISRQVIKPLFVVYNPGWIPFNAIRDFTRFWKNTPGLTIVGAMKRYIQAAPVAKLRAFGIPENLNAKQQEALKTLENLEKEKILSFTYNDLNSGLEGEDAQVEAIMSQYGLKEGQPSLASKYIPSPIKWLAEKIREVGDYVETLPKVAGYYELKNKMSAGEARLFIRRNIGSPDFFEKGYLTPIVNDIFMFSNPIIQGTFSDIGVATNPKTRSGYWWKTAKANLLPKALMFAALLGLFGGTIKKIMEGASEYDRTNYTIIPLGIDSKTGKSVYLRIPQDETGKLLSGAFWKAIISPINDQGISRDLADISSYAGGQAPNLNPVINSILKTIDFTGGKNPYDSFRGRNVISDTAFKAGGIYALKEFLVWQWNNLGGNIFKTFNVSTTPQEKQSIGEFILNFPIISNVIGRFIKVSNAGESQALRQVSQNVQAGKAAQTLNEKYVINKYVEKVNKGDLNDAEQKQLENEVVKEILGHEPANGEERARATNIKKKFRLAIKKGEADPRVDALISATSNDEKLALLSEIKKELGDGYGEFLMQLRKEGIISIQVYIKAK